MTVALTSNFFANARGVTLKDSASVTWALNANTNELSATAAGGSGLTSVGLDELSSTPIYVVTNSPLVANGTIHITLSTQAANTVFAGPTSGGAAQPGFRAFGLTDLPAEANNTVLGNVSGGSATPVALTKAQLTALVNAFTSTLSGAAPASGGGTANFLRADGTWVAPPGGSATVTQVTVTLPAPARQSHAVVVTDAAVTGASKIMLSLGGAPPTAVNEWDDIDLLDMNAVPAAGSFTLHARFLNPISGPLLLNYMGG